MYHSLHLKVCSQLSTLPREREIQSKDPTTNPPRDVRTYRNLLLKLPQIGNTQQVQVTNPWQDKH